MREQLDKHGLADRTTIGLSGCLGMCDKGPILVVNPGYTIYGRVTEADIPEIVEEHLVHNRPVARLAIQEDHLYNRFFRVFGDAKFFGKQMRITLRNCGVIDPENIDDYLACDGYEALAKVLDRDDARAGHRRDQEVRPARPRRRGLPDRPKWELTAQGAGRRRSTSSATPTRATRAPSWTAARSRATRTASSRRMTIGGYAIGADQGYIYIRAEYPLAIKRLQIAIEQAREHGLLGKNILGTGFSFDIEHPAGRRRVRLRRGDRADRLHRGQARHAAPPAALPGRKRALGQAHLINNVETWANVPGRSS